MVRPGRIELPLLGYQPSLLPLKYERMVWEPGHDPEPHLDYGYRPRELATLPPHGPPSENRTRLLALAMRYVTATPWEVDASSGLEPKSPDSKSGMLPVAPQGSGG